MQCGVYCLAECRGHPNTTSRHHMPAAAAMTIPQLSFDIQRPHLPDFELFWSSAAHSAQRVCRGGGLIYTLYVR